MADGAEGRRAWENTESHPDKEDKVTEEAENVNRDMNGPSSAEDADFIDSCSSLIEPLAPPIIENHNFTLGSDRETYIAVDDGCNYCEDNQNVNNQTADGACVTFEENVPSSEHQSNNFLEHKNTVATAICEELPDRESETITVKDKEEELLSNSQAISLHSYCKDELLDACHLIDEINNQLESSFDYVDVDVLRNHPNDRLIHPLLSSQTMDTSEGIVAKEKEFSDAACVGEAAVNVVEDTSLAAVEDILAGANAQMLDSVIHNLDSLNANIAQCAIERHYLFEEMTSDGDKDSFAFQPFGSNVINERGASEASRQDQLPTVAYGDGERYVLYDEGAVTAGPHPEDLSRTLEAQIIEFISNSNSVVRSRIEKWADELACDLECESIDGDGESSAFQLTDIPDEILLRILSYIHYSDLYTVSLVCKRWYILLSDPSLWQRIYVSADTILDPHRLCYMVSKSPQLKILTVRGEYNVRAESISVLTLYCPMLTAVDFGFAQITLPMLTQLVSRCPHITKANFEGCETITPDWIKTLCLLKKLDSVNISHCQTVDDDDVIYLAEHLSTIVNLNIDGHSLLSDSSVMSVCSKHTDSLVRLNIDGAESSDRSMAAVSACTNLMMFTISFADSLTATSIPHLLKLKRLHHLQIRKNQQVPVSSFRNLFLADSLQYLCHLDLTECIYVTDVVVESLCQCCTRLSRLVLSWCWEITDRGVEFIVEYCDNMEYLDLSGLELIEGNSFGLLPTKLPKLTYLNLAQSNRINDKLIIEVIDRMPQLLAINYYHDDFRDLEAIVPTVNDDDVTVSSA